MPRRQVLLLSGPDVAWGLALAIAWAQAGDTVTVVLLDAAAATARAGHAAAPVLAQASAAGVTLLAEEEALRRRALAGRQADGIKMVTLDEVADLLTDGADRAVWL